MKRKARKSDSGPKASAKRATKKAPVYISTQHSIDDRERFWRQTIKVRKQLPAGIRFLKGLFEADGSKATLLWEAPSPAFFHKFVKTVDLVRYWDQWTVIIDPFPAPVITKIFIFSSITAGGSVIVGGDNFLNQPGEFRLYSANFPGGFLNLGALQWGTQFAAGIIPNVVGVPDDPNASLVVVTANGRKSNHYHVRFAAKRDIVKVDFNSSAITTVKFSDAANFANVQTDTRSTLCGTHVTAYQSDDDTDVYAFQLNNGWVYHHYEWAVQDGINGGPFGQMPEPVDSSTFTVTVHWFADFFGGSADYALDIYVTGPAGVSFE